MHAILQALYEWTKEKHDDKLNARWTPPQKMWRWTWTVHKMAIDFVHVTTIVIEDLPVLSEKLINYGYIQISKKTNARYTIMVGCAAHGTALYPVPDSKAVSCQSGWFIVRMIWFFIYYDFLPCMEPKRGVNILKKKLTDWLLLCWLRLSDLTTRTRGSIQIQGPTTKTI